MATTTPPPGDRAGRKPAMRDRGKQIAALILGAAIAAFAIANFDSVRVNWIFGVWRTPLILVIAVSFLVGAAFGAVLLRQRMRQTKATPPKGRA